MEYLEYEDLRQDMVEKIRSHGARKDLRDYLHFPAPALIEKPCLDCKFLGFNMRGEICEFEHDLCATQDFLYHKELLDYYDDSYILPAPPEWYLEDSEKTYAGNIWVDDVEYPRFSGLDSVEVRSMLDQWTKGNPESVVKIVFSVR